MKSSFVIVGNIPVMDEEELAFALLETMNTLGLSDLARALVSCEIKENTAILEFDCVKTNFSELNGVAVGGRKLLVQTPNDVISHSSPTATDTDNCGFDNRTIMTEAMDVSDSNLAAMEEAQEERILQVISSNDVRLNSAVPPPPQILPLQPQPPLLSQQSFSLGGEIVITSDPVFPSLPPFSVSGPVLEVASPSPPPLSLIGHPPSMERKVSVIVSASAAGKENLEVSGSVAAKASLKIPSKSTIVPTFPPPYSLKSSSKGNSNSLASSTKPLLSRTHCIVFFDLETTGVDPRECEVLQIAAKCGEKQYNCFMKPLRGIPAGASKVNKMKLVRGKLKKNGRLVETVDPFMAWSGFLKFMEGLGGQVILVSHNGEWFDFRIAVREFRRFGLFSQFNSTVIGGADTLKIFRAKLPDRYRRRLSFKQVDLAQLYNLSTVNAHDAVGDIITLEQLCSKLNVSDQDFEKYRISLRTL